MRRCGSLDFFVDPSAERCDESIKDRCADGVFPQLGIKEIFAFDVVGDRDGYTFWINGGRFACDIARGWG